MLSVQSCKKNMQIYNIWLSVLKYENLFQKKSLSFTRKVVPTKNWWAFSIVSVLIWDKFFLSEDSEYYLPISWYSDTSSDLRFPSSSINANTTSLFSPLRISAQNEFLLNQIEVSMIDKNFAQKRKVEQINYLLKKNSSFGINWNLSNARI